MPPNPYEIATLYKISNNTIFRASIISLLAAIQLVTFNSFIMIYMQDQLLVAALIITLIVSSRNFSQIFLRIPMGELSQAIGRKPVILFGHLCYSLALLILFSATGWIEALVATLLIAIGMSAFWPSIFGYIADNNTSDNFGESNGKIFQYWDIGIIFTTFLSKYLLDIVKISLRELFLYLGIIGIFSVIVGIILLPESKKSGISIERAIRQALASFLLQKASFIQMSKNHRLFEVYKFQFLLAFLEFMMTAFFPLLIIYRGFTKGTVSEILLYSTLALFLFKPKLGKITDRFKFRNLIAIILIGSSIVSIAFLFISELWLFVLLYIIYFALMITGYTAVNGETVRRSSQDNRGSALGTLGVYLSSGRTISTIILGVFWIIFDLEFLFLITGIIVIVATILLLINSTNLKMRQVIA